MHGVKVCIVVALYFMFTKTIRFYTFLKSVSPFSGLWHVRINELVACKIIIFLVWEILRKFEDLSELVVVLVAEDDADPLVWLEEAANHSAIVKDLRSPFYNLLWIGAEEVQGFVIDLELLTLFETLVVRLPHSKDVFSVWEQDTADIILGTFYFFEKFFNNSRFSRYSFFWLTSEDEEYVLALFNQLLCLIVTGATHLFWWENCLIESISTAVKDADNKTSGQLAQASESSLKVEKRGLFLTIWHNHLAVVIPHHSMSTVVDYGQRPFA